MTEANKTPSTPLLRVRQEFANGAWIVGQMSVEDLTADLPDLIRECVVLTVENPPSKKESNNG